MLTQWYIGWRKSPISTSGSCLIAACVTMHAGNIIGTAAYNEKLPWRNKGSFAQSGVITLLIICIKYTKCTNLAILYQLRKSVNT